jgi:hypothetical protein
MLAVVAVAQGEAQPLVRVVQVVAVMVATQELLQQMRQQTQAAVEAVAATLQTSLQTAAQVWSSFVTPTLLMTRLQLRDRHPLVILAGLKFTDGPGLVQSHSEVAHGTLCTA